MSPACYYGNKVTPLPMSASRVLLSRVQLTLHATRRTPYGASRLVHAVSAWSVKPDVLCLGIVGMRGSNRVLYTLLYHTVMHEMSTSPRHPNRSLVPFSLIVIINHRNMFTQHGIVIRDELLKKLPRGLWLPCFFAILRFRSYLFADLT